MTPQTKEKEMWTGTYVLEAVRFNTKPDGPNGWTARGGKLEHVGYMKAHFRTKEDACSYYDRHHPHMRKINALGDYRSDWDPETRLLYIVRRDYMLVKTVPPFSPEDDYPIGSSIEQPFLK